MNAPANSPAAAQMNEAIKNVAAMNLNKVGGKRKSRKQKKSRGKTRKNTKARKGTRRNY